MARISKPLVDMVEKITESHMQKKIAPQKRRSRCIGDELKAGADGSSWD
jgi:hypothetical protein